MAKSDPFKADLYEEAAAAVIKHFREHFGLAHVEGKQDLAGTSGTKWEVDAKGIKTGDEGFVIVECRRYASSSLKQKHLAAIAYRVKDTGAISAIIVSPKEVQKGAKVVADHEGWSS